MKKIIILFIFIIILFCGLNIYIKNYLNSSINIESDRVILIDKGISFNKALQILEQNNIIKQQKLFKLIAIINTKNNLHLDYGEYLFEKNINIQTVLNKIIQGNVFYRKITFAEGLSTNSIVKKINDNEFLIGEDLEFTEEGILLPDTYVFTRGDSKISILNRMKYDMEKLLSELWEKRQPNLPFKTKYEALILASIVEKETGIASERGLVASVFINRMKKRMKLQTDPTVVYAFTFGDTLKERIILKSDLKNESPYNTYFIYGLPPTPIANPGIDSLKAVLNPENTEYLYFVATGNGGHHFSTTYKDHTIFVKQYRKVLKSKNNF